MEGKVCAKCGEWKTLEEYHKNKKTKDGRGTYCKECQKEYQKQWRGNNPGYHNSEQQKQYKENNKERIKEYHKQYRKDNVEYYKQYQKQLYQDNIENNLKYISSIVEPIRPIFKELNLPVYGYIYKFENVKTGHQYLGQSTLPLDRRYGSNVIKSWIKERKEHENQKFKEELIEEDIILTEVLDVAFCKYHLDKLETYYIQKYDSCNNGYNNEYGNHNTNDGLEEFMEILEQHNLEFVDEQIVKKN